MNTLTANIDDIIVQKQTSVKRNEMRTMCEQQRLFNLAVDGTLLLLLCSGAMMRLCTVSIASRAPDHELGPGG